MQARLWILALALAAAFCAQGQTGTGRGTPKPGQTFTECRNCPQMMVLPAGKVTIGSPADEPLRRENEPQKEITFARPFAMATTAVTWDQWEACVRDRWCDGIAIDTALRTGENGQPNPDYKDYGRGTRPVTWRTSPRERTLKLSPCSVSARTSPAPSTPSRPSSP